MEVFTERDIPRGNLVPSLDKEAHVWLFRPQKLARDDLEKSLRNTLSADETQRLNRFFFEKDRKLFLAAHGGLRRILSLYGNVEPREWQFDLGDHGRPEISSPHNPQNLRFNLSHCTGLVACLIARKIDCGVDVERIGRVRDPKSLARSFFADLESKEIEHCQTEEATGLLFCRYWTLKEAYIKARGVGLTISLSQFHFTLKDDGTVSIHFAPEFEDTNDNWLFFQKRPTDEHILSVALKKGAAAGLKIYVRECIKIAKKSSKINAA